MSGGRKSYLVWHRWFGLLAAVWLFLLSLTGSIIVFQKELDTALNPDLVLAQEQGEPRPYQEIADQLAGSFPGKIAEFMVFPEDGQSVQVFIGPLRVPGDSDPTDADFLQTYSDPATAGLLGSRQYGEAGIDRRRLTQFIYQLHKDLLLGPWMKWFLGFVALAWLIDHIFAAMLSFPVAKRWVQSFAIRWRRGGYKRTFDMHRAVGLWLFPVTLILAATGIAFNWPETFHSAVASVAKTSSSPLEGIEPLAVPDNAPQVSVDEALAIAKNQPSIGRLHAVSWHAPLGVWWVRAEDAQKPDQLTHGIIVDYDGQLIAHRVTGQEAGDIIHNWVFPLHSGQAFGWAGRIAVFVTGIATCMFIVTGLIMWARKRRSRKPRQTNFQMPVALQPAE
jgi:uncharacterized iron-regulated membrane protein